MNGSDALCESVRVDGVSRKFVVHAILDDEFHLVVRTQSIEVAPVDSVGLAAAWTLDVKNGHDGVGHPGGTAVTAGF
jgi:hypothetical protein